MNEKILNYFAKYIEAELGIVYHEANYFQLQHRLEQITNQLGLEGLEVFYQKAQTGLSITEKAFLLDTATNNETSFFRDAGLFRALESDIFVKISNAKKEANDFKPIRLWSAASSAGQEVYSIAMTYDMFKKTNPSLIDLQIEATDISSSILKRAEEASYSQLEVQRGLSAKLLLEYFEKTEGERWRAKTSLRSGISFKRLNLLEEFYGLGPYDIVFCRNVLIYQPVENKIKILKKIHKVMSSDAYLFLGAAESLIGLSDDFHQIEIGGSIVFKKK